MAITLVSNGNRMAGLRFAHPWLRSAQLHRRDNVEIQLWLARRFLSVAKKAKYSVEIRNEPCASTS
jgi:hypothetical protein